MKIIEQRYLRGPNLYSGSPCLLAVLDLGSWQGVAPAGIAGLGAQLLHLLPALPPTGANFADVVRCVTMELQALAGAPAGFSQTEQMAASPARYRLVCAYRCERVAAAALEGAIGVVGTLAAGGHYPLDRLLARLRQLAQRSAIGTSTAAVLAAAQRRGIPCTRITEHANLFQLGWGSRQRRLQATLTGATSQVAVEMASNKHLTKTLLRQAGLPVPAGDIVTSAAQALRVARGLRGAVTVKPLDANQGKGVSAMCRSEAEINAAFERARQHGRQVIVERHLTGHDYRVLVTGGVIAAAARRRPPIVTGDGASTITALVEAENRHPARGEGHSNILTRIALDEHALATLRRQGYGADSVPDAGVAVTLRDNANLSTGGTAEDVTDLLAPSTARLCIRAALTIGLDVAGIDIVCEDIARPLDAQHGGIIEVNAAPGIRMHQHPSSGTARDAGAAIVQAMFGDDDGRIAVVAVTGTNGKTTTTRLIGHAAGLSGLTTGMATTQGLYIADTCLRQGDCTGYHSARAVLAAPDVQFAVLETARGGILKRGLAFDRCDVSVVLNISADHLGLDGIDTLQDMARVKQVVADAGAMVVLNADDALCVDMAARLRDGTEVLYFSLDPDNPVLLRHLAEGGRAAYLQDHMIVLANGGRHVALLDARQAPVTLGGLARHNIANALAATAALAAAGQHDRDIARGLASFVSDARSNPLRSNVFDVDGVRVILDFAHNAAAYAALSGMARGMTSARVVGVVSAPGDRRDSDLQQIGTVCASGFDDLVIYEAENRGRPEGDVARQLMQGARHGGADVARLFCKIEVHHAIRFGLSLCHRGDVLVFGCSSSIDELLDAIRREHPEAAARIGAEAAAPLAGGHTMQSGQAEAHG